MSQRLPISLILDDSGPINLMAGQDPQPWRVRNVPPSFLEAFIRETRAQGVRGKFTVVPNPNGWGSLDEGVAGYPPEDLRRFLDLVRTEVQPLWDITPELITHGPTLELATGRFLPIREDAWAATQNADTLTDYLTHALQTLKNVGLQANGITSPYYFGIEVEQAYAEAVERSLSRVYSLKESWYFLHYSMTWADVRPRIMRQDREKGTSVVSVVVCTEDSFWDAQNHRSFDEGLAAIQPQIDALLSPDGTKGRFVEVLASRQPIVFLTHWQSLFCEGTGAGLAGLVELAARVNRHLGDRVEWTVPSEIARMTLA